MNARSQHLCVYLLLAKIKSGAEQTAFLPYCDCKRITNIWEWLCVFQRKQCPLVLLILPTWERVCFSLSVRFPQHGFFFLPWHILQSFLYFLTALAALYALPSSLTSQVTFDERPRAAVCLFQDEALGLRGIKNRIDKLMNELTNRKEQAAHMCLKKCLTSPMRHIENTRQVICVL